MASTFFVNKKKCQIKVRELARIHLHHAILSHDEVRHYRQVRHLQKSVILTALPCSNQTAYFYQLIGTNFRHTSKTFEEGSTKKKLKEKIVFPKNGVELRTFDGTIVNLCKTE